MIPGASSLAALVPALIAGAVLGLWHMGRTRRRAAAILAGRRLAPPIEIAIIALAIGAAARGLGPAIGLALLLGWSLARLVVLERAR